MKQRRKTRQNATQKRRRERVRQRRRWERVVLALGKFFQRLAFSFGGGGPR